MPQYVPEAMVPRPRALTPKDRVALLELWHRVFDAHEPWSGVVRADNAVVLAKSRLRKGGHI